VLVIRNGTLVRSARVSSVDELLHLAKLAYHNEEGIVHLYTSGGLQVAMDDVLGHNKLFLCRGDEKPPGKSFGLVQFLSVLFYQTNKHHPFFLTLRSSTIPTGYALYSETGFSCGRKLRHLPDANPRAKQPKDKKQGNCRAGVCSSIPRQLLDQMEEAETKRSMPYVSCRDV
jgi:hypothetical protein